MIWQRLFGMVCMFAAIVILVLALEGSRKAERTAYARGYAAAVDSVRLADTVRVLARSGRVVVRPLDWTMTRRGLTLWINSDGAVHVSQVPTTMDSTIVGER